MTAENLARGLGTVQRRIMLHMHSLDGKGSSIGRLCTRLAVADTERDGFYKAAKLLRRRKLLRALKKGRKVILFLTSAGHAAAYAIVEDEGQTTMTKIKVASGKPAQ